GMIHHFKNYVLRHDENYYVEAQSKLGGVSGLISQYKSLGPSTEELNALNNIGGVVDQYTDSLEQAKLLIEQGKSPTEIDTVVRIDDSPAIKGMAILKQLYDVSVATELPMLEKFRYLSELRHVLGYDGMIHHYKNYLLRKDQNDLNIARDNLQHASEQITNLRILDLTDAEKTALIEIEDVIGSYTQALVQAESLIKLNYTTSELDSEVQVNDVFAINALVTLDRALAIQSEKQAENMSLTISGFNDVISLVNNITPIIGILFICSLIWMLKSRVIDPIGKVAHLTKRLAEGDLSIHIDKELMASDEIGEMANALSIFKRNAIERNEAESRLRKILEITPQALITVDKNFNVQMFNKGAMNVFGYIEKQVIGKSMEMLIPEQYRETHYSHIANYMNVSSPRNLLMGQRGEISGLKKDGSTFPAIASIAKIDHGGESMYLVALVDISKQKRIERKLQKALDQTEKANLVKSEFMASMSHELRTPLNSILGFSEVMKDEHMGPLGSQQYIGYATNIHNSGRHLLDMVNDILDIERIETGNIKLKIEEIIVLEILEECRQLIRQRADEKEIRLNFDVSDDVESFSADRRSIIQILTILLVNAMKFTEQGGFVNLKITTEDGKFIFKVSDTGIGIPKEKIDMLTNPFVRHESDPHKTQEGVGLGLAISNSLVKLHFGEMKIESTVGVGTVITVILPDNDQRQLHLI
ncbi:MAG: PAS domain S-box protein, partial [Kordiimonadaceae bacterium]|nr:PAS domain S-box protein [Kordiimonadaceae bacterium]